jgi:hypothetical protein
MGRNSKARRDARKRKEARRQSAPRTRPGSPFGLGSDFEGVEPDPVAFADLRIVFHVRRMGPRGSAEEAHARAASLQRELSPWPLAVACNELLKRILTPVLGGGWSPSELAEVVDRILGGSNRGLLAGLIGSVRRPGEPDAANWDAQISALGRPRQFVADDRDDLALALRLAALFAALPVGDIPVQRSPARAPGSMSSRTSAKLEQVRLLLAKAEATTFADEAEALSAKAQELISKHSLEELLEQVASQDGRKERTATYRRLWLEAPYVDAKANLVHQVSEANRCRAVYSTTLGFCTVVGAAFDIDAVELMVTSLLTQAQRAMLRHGSRTDGGGRSRTRSFRQSFLVSFAVHIGKRLRRAAEESVAAAGDSALLPVLRGHEAEVHEFADALFPHVTEMSSSASNAEGWAGGRFAAELADLDIFEAVRA